MLGPQLTAEEFGNLKSRIVISSWGGLRRATPYTFVRSRNRSVYIATELLYHGGVTSDEFKRWLEKRGCTFELGKGGHLKASR
jgi:hypothetical protein